MGAPRSSRNSQMDAAVDSRIHADAAPQALDPALKGKLPISELNEDEAIVHALNRLGYGPRPGDLDRVKRMGLENWIEHQLHPKKSRSPRYKLAWRNCLRRI